MWRFPFHKGPVVCHSLLFHKIHLLIVLKSVSCISIPIKQLHVGVTIFITGFHFTNELEMVSDVEHRAPLGRSDYQQLKFSFKYYFVLFPSSYGSVRYSRFCSSRTMNSCIDSTSLLQRSADVRSVR